MMTSVHIFHEQRTLQALENCSKSERLNVSTLNNPDVRATFLLKIDDLHRETRNWILYNSGRYTYLCLQ